jgi:hypothetical protein
VPSPLTIFLGLVVLFAVAFIGFAVGVVLFSGGSFGPADACENPVTGEERPIARDSTTAQAFQQAWINTAGQIAGGAPDATVALDEARVTARAAEYLEERDAPIEDLVICFHGGEAEARATVEAPGLSGLPLVGDAFKTNAKLTGTVDLSGQAPRLIVHDFDAGHLPGFLEDQVRDQVEDAVNDRLSGLRIVHQYETAFTEGTATVVVRPSPPATVGQ